MNQQDFLTIYLVNLLTDLLLGVEFSFLAIGVSEHN